MALRYVFLGATCAALLITAGCRERRVLSSSGSDQGSSSVVTREAMAPELAAAADEGASDMPPDVEVPSLSEAVARALLAERFRQAGFRVRYDLVIERPGLFHFAVDGYDPKTRVGYEYIAAAERDTDLKDAERAALRADPEFRILVIDATEQSQLEQQAQEFLQALGEPSE